MVVETPISLTIGGANVGSNVISLRTEQDICRVAQTCTIALDPNVAANFNPWDEIAISINGTGRFKGYVDEPLKGREPAEYIVRGTDVMKRALDNYYAEIAQDEAGLWWPNPFVVEQELDAGYWVDYWLKHIGITTSGSVETGRTVPVDLEWNFIAVSDIILECLGYAGGGWTVIVDGDGVAQISKKLIGAASHTFDSSNIIGFSRSQEDSWRRDRAAVFGDGVVGEKPDDPAGCTRAAALSSTFIKTQAVADGLAQDILDFFDEDLDIKRCLISGDASIWLGETAAVTDPWTGYSGTGLITSIETTVDDRGFRQLVSLDEKCGFIWGWGAKQLFGAFMSESESRLYFRKALLTSGGIVPDDEVWIGANVDFTPWLHASCDILVDGDDVYIVAEDCTYLSTSFNFALRCWHSPDRGESWPGLATIYESRELWPSQPRLIKSGGSLFIAWGDAHSWHMPTSNYGGWTDSDYAHDGYAATCAYYEVVWDQWTPFLILDIEPVLCDALRYDYRISDYIQERADVDIYTDGQWLHIYEGGRSPPYSGAWQERRFDYITERRKVSTSADDGYENDRTHVVHKGNVYNWQGYNAGAAEGYWNFLRFTNIELPQGARIISASLAFWFSGADDPYAQIHCEDVDDAVDLDATNDIDGRSRTNNKVAWTTPNRGFDGWKYSPNIAAPIQEVIDRPGWASGNALAFILEPYGTADQCYCAFSYDKSVTKAPNLRITYALPEVPCMVSRVRIRLKEVFFPGPFDAELNEIQLSVVGHGIQLSTSADEGQTWDSREVLEAAYGRLCPGLVADSLGNLYISGFTPTGDHVYVAKSVDGGLSFGAPVCVNPGEPGDWRSWTWKYKLYIDDYDNLFVLFDELEHTSWDDEYIALSISTDGGASFCTPFQIVEDPTGWAYHSCPFLMFDEQRIYLFYTESAGYGSGEMKRVISEDGGWSWGSTGPVTGPDAVQLALNRKSGDVLDTDIWLTYNSGDDIKARLSSDEGLTWSDAGLFHSIAGESETRFACVVG